MNWQRTAVLLAIVTAFGGIAIVSIASHAQTKKRQAAPHFYLKGEPGGLAANASHPDEEPAPEPFLVVEPLRKTTGPSLDLHRQIAAAMTNAKLTAPNHRIRHFQWLDANPEIKFLGWHGFIEGTQPIPGGQLVTIRITPRITTGVSSVTSDHSFERYAIVGNKITLVEAIDPPDGSPGVAVGH